MRYQNLDELDLDGLEKELRESQESLRGAKGDYRMSPYEERNPVLGATLDNLVKSVRYLVDVQLVLVREIKKIRDRSS